MHTWTILIIDCHTISKFPGGCEWFDRHQKCVAEVSVHFKLELNALRDFSVHTFKNVKY
jgi:hypothetical protein